MNRIRWGVIGCGDVVRQRVAQAILDDPRSELVAACRRNESALNEFCQNFAVPQAYTDARQLLASAALDAVYIATPVNEHLAQALEAASRGKHVLVEKPMATNSADCERMIEACREADVKLGIAYYRRFYPIVDRIRELLAEQTIGQLLAVSAVTATPLDMRPGDEGYWRASVDAGGGGALMDVGSHRIDLFRHLFGQITGVGAICETVAADYEVEDSAVLLLRFASGMVGTLQCHFGCDDPDEFAITGTKGRLIARPLNGETLVIEADGLQRTERHPPPVNFCAPLIDDFVSAILDDRNPAVDGRDGLATNSVMERAYAAGRLFES